MNTAFGIIAFITRCSFPVLGAVALVHEYELSRQRSAAWLRLQFFNECVEVFDILAAKLMYQ